MFQFQIKDNREQKFSNFFLFAVLLNVTLFAWLLITGEKNYILLTGLLFSFLLFTFYLFRKTLLQKKSSPFLLMVLALCWIIEKEWLPALINIVFIFSGVYLKKIISLSVDENGIIVHSFPLKKISWIDSDNVLIKDGLFTIDLKNNKLFQFATDHSIDETSFNSFCKKQIEKTQMQNS